MASKTMTRFKAAFKGLVSVIKETNRRSIIDNVLKANELSNDSELLSINEKKAELVNRLATCSDAEIKGIIKELCSLFDSEEACMKSKEYSAKITALLDENVEVEEKK